MKKLMVAMTLALLMLEGAWAADADFFVIESAPGEMVPGKSYDLNATIKNLGTGYAAYLKATLDPQDVSPIDPLGASTRSLGKAEGAEESEQYFGAVVQSEEIELSYPVYVREGVRPGVYQVPLQLEWKAEKMAPKTQMVNINVLVEGDIAIGVGDVVTDPRDMRAGDDSVKLTVAFTNSGRADAREVKVHLQPQGPFQATYSESNRVFIGTLASGQAKSANFFLDLEETASPGKYTLPISVSYEDRKGNSYTRQKEVELMVKPKPYFQVSSHRVEPRKITPGTKVRLSVDVENIGHEEGESVELRVIRETGQPFSFDVRSDYIGTLAPGQEGTAVLEFDVEEGAAAKKNLLKLSLRSVGDSERGDDNVYTQELQVPVEVREGSREETSYLPYALAAVVALGIALYLARVVRR